MEKEDLELRINLLLDKEINDSKTFENAKLLRDLFHSFDSEEELQSHFLEIISLPRSPYLFSITFYVLVLLGKKDLAIEILTTGHKIPRFKNNIFLIIEKALKEGKLSLTLEEKSELIKKLYNLYPSTKGLTYKERIDLVNNKNAIISTLYTLAAKDITEENQGVNIEINRDKEQVQEALENLNFDEKYNKLLNSIDKSLDIVDEIETSGMIGNLRAFFEDFVKDLAKKIAAKEGEEIPTSTDKNIGEIGKCRKYIQIKLELSSKDNKLINSFVDILHDEGGHSFVSNKEYFRLTRNIGIEIILFLLSKYETKYTK